MKLSVKFYGDYNVITGKLCNRAIHYIPTIFVQFLDNTNNNTFYSPNRSNTRASCYRQKLAAVAEFNVIIYDFSTGGQFHLT